MTDEDDMMEWAERIKRMGIEPRRTNQRLGEGRMTDEQINRAIAECFGWKLERTEGGGKITRPGGLEVELKPWHWATMHFYRELPDYVNDLNVMRVAEQSKVLTDAHYKRKDRLSYEDILVHVVLDGKYTPGMGGKEAYATAITASARQRAEAFLRTVGRWEE